MPSGRGCTSAGERTPARRGRAARARRCTPTPCPRVTRSPVSSMQRDAPPRAVQPVGVAVDRHEPARVPGRVAPAVLAHAAALVDLQVEAGRVVAVQVEQQADAVERPQVGVARPRLRPAARACPPGAGSAGRRRGSRGRRPASASVGYSFGRSSPTASRRTSGLSRLPAGVVELAVEERPRRRLAGTGQTGLGGGPVRLASHSSAAAASRHGPSGCARPRTARYHSAAVSKSPSCRRAACRQNCTAGSLANSGRSRQPRLRAPGRPGTSARVSVVVGQQRRAACVWTRLVDCAVRRRTARSGPAASGSASALGGRAGARCRLTTRNWPSSWRRRASLLAVWRSSQR